MDFWETALVVARFIEFSASILLFGSLAFRLCFRRKLVGPGAAIDRWLKPVLLAAAVLALLGSVAWLDVEAATMGNGWKDALDPRTISAVLFQTVFGRVWLWHLAVALILAGAILLLPARYQELAKGLGLLGLATVLVASAAWAGHAVMSRGGAAVVQLGAQIVHLLAVSAWLGSLPALAYVLRRARCQAAWADIAQYILPRYSLIGYGAVGLILLSGCVNSWFLVGSVRALFGTSYGHVLLAKLALVALMIGIAIVNRVAFEPKVLRLTGGAGAMPLKSLSLTVVVEQLVGLSIVALTSVLGTLAPATMR